MFHTQRILGIFTRRVGATLRDIGVSNCGQWKASGDCKGERGVTWSFSMVECGGLAWRLIFFFYYFCDFFFFFGFCVVWVGDSYWLDSNLLLTWFWYVIDLILVCYWLYSSMLSACCWLDSSLLSACYWLDSSLLSACSWLFSSMFVSGLSAYTIEIYHN